MAPYQNYIVLRYIYAIITMLEMSCENNIKNYTENYHHSREYNLMLVNII